MSDESVQSLVVENNTITGSVEVAGGSPLIEDNVITAVTPSITVNNTLIEPSGTWE